MTKAWLKDRKVKTFLITVAVTVVSVICTIVLDED